MFHHKLTWNSDKNEYIVTFMTNKEEALLTLLVSKLTNLKENFFPNPDSIKNIDEYNQVLDEIYQEGLSIGVEFDVNRYKL